MTHYLEFLRRERLRDAAAAAATVANAIAADTLEASALASPRLFALACAELLARLDCPRPSVIVPALADRCALQFRLHRLAHAFGVTVKYGDFISREHVEAVANTGSSRQRKRARAALALAGLGPSWPHASCAERAALMLRALVMR